jgi:ribosomal protein S18 acetylase RimI-like enzyme
MIAAILVAGKGKTEHPAAHVTTIVFQHVTPYPLKTRKMPMFVDAYVNLVYTNEKYRGRGYAGILLRLFTRWFDEKGKVANLDVAALGDVKEIHLIRFYKHEGFELVEKINDITGGAIMVRKPIKPSSGKKGKVSSTRVATPKAELDQLLAMASKAGL